MNEFSDQQSSLINDAGTQVALTYIVHFSRQSMLGVKPLTDDNDNGDQVKPDEELGIGLSQ